MKAIFLILYLGLFTPASGISLYETCYKDNLAKLNYKRELASFGFVHLVIIGLLLAF